MATVFDNSTLVNDIARQMLGESAVAITDTTGLMDFGNVVISSAANTDLFYKIMTDRIANTIVAEKIYTAMNRRMRRRNQEWGMYLQKLRMKTKNRATTDPALDVAGMQHSPYDVESSSEVIQQIFGKNLPAWTIEDVLPGQTQLFTAFTSFDEFNKLIAAIRIEIENEIQTEMEALDNVAIATLIAFIFKKGKTTQKINVVKRYNEDFGTALTNETCRHDPSYLKYRVQLMKNTKEFLRVRSELYNAETNYANFTNSDDMILEVLTEAASDIMTYMTSDTYHKEFVEMTGYSEIPCWQGLGSDNTYASHAAVKIKHDDVDGEDVEVKNVIAVMRSEDAVATHFDKKREWAKYNERDDVTPFGLQFIRSYAIDTYENCVIFYDDADEV